jgi:hypothetical protein
MEALRAKERMGGGGKMPFAQRNGKCHPHTREMPRNKKMEVSGFEC